MSQVSLRSRVLRAGGWTLGSHITGQTIRLASNLILARLLFPEAFGTMAIVAAVLAGVTMFTDVGLSLSVIRSVRGADPRFLNTVWTLQILKGIAVAIALLCLAWPFAWIFNIPALGPMIATIGLVSVIGGAQSTKLELATRDLQAKRITLLALGSQLISIAAVVCVAWVWPSPWALLWGSVVGTALNSIGSHVVLQGPSNKLAWDKEGVREVFHFGGWILLSSGLTFLASEGLQLVRASLVDLRLMGLIGMGAILSLAFSSATNLISGNVMFPAYAEVWRKDPSRLRDVVARARMAILIPSWLFSATLVVFGPALIAFLYDDRYTDMGLIIQIQSAGLCFSMVASAYTTIPFVIGKPGLNVFFLATQGLIELTGLLVGMAVAGPLGMIIGGAIGGLINYPVAAIVYYRLNLWQPGVDIPFLLLSVMPFAWLVWAGNWSDAARW